MVARMSLRAKAITERLGGRWYSTANYGVVPCVAHEDEKPSLRLRDGDHGLLVHCYSGCEVAEVLARLRALGLGAHGPQQQDPAADARGKRESEVEEAKRQKSALKLWHTGRPISGTIAEFYLRHRAITSPLPSTIRYLADGKHGPTGLPFPTMVAAIANLDRRVTAVHRTFLRFDGAGKAGVSSPKMALGHIGRGAVRLGAAGEELGIAEGIETGLSAQQLFGVPVWCACGSWLERIAVPDTVRRIIVFADNGAPGELAAEKATRVHHDAGRVVDVHFPSIGDDFNDELRARAGEGRAG